MAREPHYPDDAPVGDAISKDAAAERPPSPQAGDRGTGAETAAEGKRTKQIMAGAAIGIGSAAIVAALLYANRRGKTDKG